MTSSSLRDHLNGMSEERRSYTLQTLAQHLYQASQYNRLHDLIIQDWMLLRLENGGNYGGFLGDVNLAWECIYQADHPQMELQIRYALILSSIKSLAINVHPLLFPLFLECKIWNFDEAATFALQIPDLRKRCEVLIRLGNVVSLSEAQRCFLFTEVLKVEWPLQDTSNQGHLIESLAPVLPESLFPEALRIARKIQDPESQQSALSTLALYTSSQQERQVVFTEALALAQHIASPNKRVWALANLAPFLTSDLIEEILRLIETSVDTDKKAERLKHIAGYLPEQLHPRVLAFIQSKLEVAEQFDVLMALATRRTVSYLPFGGDNGFQPLSISVASSLPEELKRLEITLAEKIALGKIQDGKQQAKMFCALAKAKPDMQAEALERILLYGRQGQVGYMAEDLSRYLKPELHDRMIEVLPEFTEEYDQVAIIRGLAPLLSTLRLTRLLEQTDHMPKRGIRLEAIGLLIPLLPEPQRTMWAKKAHQQTSLIDDKQIRELVISELIQQKTSASLDHSREMVGTESPAVRLALRRINTNMRKYLFRCDWIFVNNLRAVFPHLNEEQMKECFDIWAKEANWWTNPFVAYFIGTMAPYIPNGLYSTVFDFALAKFQQKVGNDTEYTYLCALADLAKSLPPSLLPHVTNSVQSMQNSMRCTCASIALAPFFYSYDSKVPAYDHAINTARAIADPRVRRWTFLSLIPYLLPEYLDEAINEVWEIIIEKYYAAPGYLNQFALVRLGPMLPMERFDQVVDILDNMTYMEYMRNVFMNSVSQRLKSLSSADKLEYWNMILRKLANRGRPNFLAYLEVFAPAIGLNENQVALRSIIKDILEISTWWP